MLKVPRNYKRITLAELNDDGCLNLLEAYVKSLAEDYRSALRLFLADKKDKKTYDSLMNIRNIFLSKYFSDMTGLNGEAILYQLDKPYLDKLA